MKQKEEEGEAREWSNANRQARIVHLDTSGRGDPLPQALTRWRERRWRFSIFSSRSSISLAVCLPHPPPSYILLSIHFAAAAIAVVVLCRLACFQTGSFISLAHWWNVSRVGPIGKREKQGPVWPRCRHRRHRNSFCCVRLKFVLQHSFALVARNENLAATLRPNSPNYTLAIVEKQWSRM